MGLKFGENAGRIVSQRIAQQFATAALLASSLGSGDADDGMVGFCGDGSRWRYSSASTATADGLNLLCMSPNDSPSAGRWLRDDDVIDLKIPVAFGTADATVLLTIPVGFRLQIVRSFWEATVAFTGGASSAIGIDSSNANSNTAGDLLGGATGDVAAALGTGALGGTVGAKIASSPILVAADTIKFNRITSAFTAGSGFAHVMAIPIS